MSEIRETAASYPLAGVSGSGLAFTHIPLCQSFVPALEPLFGWGRRHVVGRRGEVRRRGQEVESPGEFSVSFCVRQEEKPRR